MSYVQFVAACAAGLIWHLLGWPQSTAVALGFLTGIVIYNLSANRPF